MKNHSYRLTGILPVLATSLFLIASARANQVVVGNPTPSAPVPYESRFDIHSVTFEIVNTGVPVTKAVIVGNIDGLVIPGSGDGKFDVISFDDVSGCSNTLLNIGQSCFVRADYVALDGDPFDSDHADPGDSALWALQVLVPWKVPGGGAFGTAVGEVDVTVKDDPATPEPSTISLLTLGLVGIGSVLRNKPALMSYKLGV